MSTPFIATAAIAIAVWVGAIVFQSTIVAPTVFRHLDQAAARRFLRALFPRMYRLGLMCGAILLSSLAIAGISSHWPVKLVLLLGASMLMILLEGSALWLVPRINRARDAGSEGERRFKALHRVSVLLSLLVLVIGITVLASLVSPTLCLGSR